MQEAYGQRARTIYVQLLDFSKGLKPSCSYHAAGEFNACNDLNTGSNQQLLNALQDQARMHRHWLAGQLRNAIDSDWSVKVSGLSCCRSERKGAAQSATLSEEELYAPYYTKLQHCKH